MNSTPTTISAPVLSEARLEAIALVLPSRLMRPEVPVDVARVTGKVKAMQARKAQRVGLTGLHGLSNTGIDAALAFAQRTNAAILLPALPGMTRDDGRPVSQHISLAEACKAQLILWVGCDGSCGPVADWLVRHQFVGAVVPGDLSSVLGLRAAVKKNAFAEPIGQKKRAAVVIGPTVERSVSSQWHHLAADIQTTCRMGVLSLPDIDLTLNGRGLFEAIGVRFGMGVFQSALGEVLWANPARITPGVDAISKAGAFDLVLDFAPEPTPGIAKALHVPSLAGCPCLWPGMDAQLTRFDAQTVGLADEGGDADWAAMVMRDV